MAGEQPIMHEDKKIKGFDEFEVRGWLRSFQEVDEIKKDSKKMEAVKELAENKLKLSPVLQISEKSLKRKLENSEIPRSFIKWKPLLISSSF